MPATRRVEVGKRCPVGKAANKDPLGPTDLAYEVGCGSHVLNKRLCGPGLHKARVIDLLARNEVGAVIEGPSVDSATCQVEAQVVALIRDNDLTMQVRAGQEQEHRVRRSAVSLCLPRNPMESDEVGLPVGRTGHRPDGFTERSMSWDCSFRGRQGPGRRESRGSLGRRGRLSKPLR